MKNLTWQNPEQLFVAQVLINKVKSKCCGIKVYYESDVTSITPRKVEDSEFILPSDYKISKGAKNAFALLKYFKGVKKQLEKLGVKGESNDKKTTGVHYKTNGEWDF